MRSGGLCMHKKKFTLIEITQLISALMILIFYLCMIFFVINAAKHITGYVLGILFLIRGIYPYKTSKEKREGIMFIILAITFIFINLV